MNKLFSAASLAVMVSCGALGLASSASSAAVFLPYYTNYEVLSSDYAVKDVAIFEYNPYGDITNSFSVPANSDHLITNPFVQNSPVTGAFLLGVASDLASDAGTEQSHLVVFANDDFVSSAQDIAFGTLFPNTNEASLIDALEVIGQDPPGGDTTTAYDTLFAFENGDAQTSPNGSVAFQIGDAFEEVAFSGGQTIGDGVSFATPVPLGVSSAPEPSAWVLMFAGVAGLGLALRRTREGLDSQSAAACTG